MLEIRAGREIRYKEMINEEASVGRRMKLSNANRQVHLEPIKFTCSGSSKSQRTSNLK